MTNHKLGRNAWIGALVLISVVVLYSTQIYPQGAKKSSGGKVCSDPTVPCKTVETFDPNDLPFQIPTNAVIWETGKFYAIILKSVRAPNDACEVFISEDERLKAQRLFPKFKVFASRCQSGGMLYYSNVTPNQHFMAVYAGITKAQAESMLAKVKATGKYPGANIRRMTVGFNGT